MINIFPKKSIRRMASTPRGRRPKLGGQVKYRPATSTTPKGTLCWPSVSWVIICVGWGSCSLAHVLDPENPSPTCRGRNDTAQHRPQYVRNGERETDQGTHKTGVVYRPDFEQGNLGQAIEAGAPHTLEDATNDTAQDCQLKSESEAGGGRG